MADLNDFQKPDLTSAYSSEVLQTIQGNIARAAKMDPGTATNIPVGFIKFSEGSFYKWDGASWNMQPLLIGQNSGDITYSSIVYSGQEVTAQWGTYKLYLSQAEFLPTLSIQTSFANTAIQIDGQFSRVIGGRKVDSIYVKAGSSCNLGSLANEADIIYLTGSWASYKKTVISQLIKLNRFVNGLLETIYVSAISSSSGNDKLVFADGLVMSFNAATALAANPNCAITDVSGYDAATKTPISVDSSFATVSSPIPSNKLLANGQLVSRSDYPMLFSKIGTSFGVGDGATTFQLPTIPDIAPNVKAFISI